MPLRTPAAIELRQLLIGALTLVDVLSPLLNGVEIADFSLLVHSLSDESTRRRLYDAVSGLSAIGPNIGAVTIDELIEIVSEFRR